MPSATPAGVPVLITSPGSKQSHEIADVADQGRDVEDHVRGRAPLPDLPVHLEPHAERARVGQLVPGGEERPERREGVGALAFHPLAAALELKAALRIVVVQRVAGDEPDRLLARDIPGGAADDDRELDFPIELGAAARDDDAVVRARQRRGRLEEDHRLAGDVRAAFRGVIAKVDADADDLARTADGRSQPNLVRHPRRRRFVTHEPCTERVDAVAREKRLVVVGAERGDVEAPSLVQQNARPLGARGPESNQLHATSTPPSMGYAWPVTNAASSEHRYNASDATSSGRHMRPMGWYSSSRRRISASRPG